MNGNDLNTTDLQSPDAPGPDPATGTDPVVEWESLGAIGTPFRPVQRNRRERMRKRNRRLTRIQGALTVVFLAAFVGLLVVGRTLVLDLQGGPGLGAVTDPTAPGYRAEVTPTPVMLALLTDPSGELASAVLLIQNLSGGGTVVPVATDLLLPTAEPQSDVAMGELPTGDDAERQAPLHEMFRAQGPALVGERLGVALAMAIGDAVVVSAAEAEAAFEASGEVTIDNPTDLVDAEGRVAFPSGPTTLAPDEVVGFLGPVDPTEIAPNRALRSQLVWDALLRGRRSGAAGGAASTAPDIAVAGPDGAGAGVLEVGFEPFLRAIAAGDSRSAAVPVDRLRPGGPGRADEYWVSRWRVPEFVSLNVPFPQSAFPGQRLRAVLLNGTTDPSVFNGVTSELVLRGMEIDKVGNADSLDAPGSTIRYRPDDARAEAMATYLAAGRNMALEPLASGGSTDIEIVLGKDRL